MTGHQLVEGWRSFALSLRDILDLHEQELTKGIPASHLHWDVANPPGDLSKIAPLFQEQVVVLSTALRYNLPAIQALFDTAGDVDADPASYWLRVANALDITRPQLQKLEALWRGYSARMGSLVAQRAHVVESMRHAARVADLGGCPVGNLHLMMQQYCSLFDASGKLAATPDSELMALMELMQGTGKVWTLMQKAKLVAMSHPAFPDIVQFLRAVVGDGGGVGSGTGLVIVDADDTNMTTTTAIQRNNEEGEKGRDAVPLQQQRLKMLKDSGEVFVDAV